MLYWPSCQFLGVSTVAEHSNHYHKFEGLNPGDIGRGKMALKVANFKLGFLAV
jgi:hypothetical protein